jgi:hypothetical protein
MPFALVGVVLLVSSTTLAATVVTHDPSSTPTVDRAMAGAEAETVTALRTAADDAATATAATPVTVPADSTAGRALDEDRPFRGALRLRLYLLARDRLESVRVRRGEVVANASLPPVPDTVEGYRTAIERVTVERAGTDDAALRVRIQGVSVTGVRNGRSIASEALSPTFVVSNPALFVQDRVDRFERRTNAPVDQPGLGRRLTARLYPITWARGYAQYGGAPIANVLGTRHVELATNDALVAEQRRTFGTADPGADRAVTAAGLRVATQDLLAAKDVDHEWTDTVLRAAEDRAAGRTQAPPVGTSHDPPDQTDVTVGINGSATIAYGRTIGVDDHDDDLAAAIERAHTVQARVTTETATLGVETDRAGTVDGSWSLVGEETTSHVTLRRVDGRLPRADGWETRDGASFRAVQLETTERRWRRNGEVRTTRSVVERTYRVDVAVQARTAPVPGAPQGHLDGPLASATARAVGNALADAGGIETAARQAVEGDPPSAPANATAEPTVERATVTRQVRALRDRTKRWTTTVPSTDLAAGRANPPERLRRNVTANHDALRGHADRTVEARTHVAAREAYLRALEAHLADRADRQDEVNQGVTDEVTDHVDPGVLDGALSADRTRSSPPGRSWTDPAGTLSLAVETGPSYLPTSEVDRDRIGARRNGTVHPLKTRNLNVFASPHGQAASRIVQRLPIIGSDTASLATAAQVLARMNESDDGYESLHEEVAAANEHVRERLVGAMADAGVPLSDAEAAIETNASTAATAAALANGSTADRAVAATGARDDVDRDTLRVRLHLARRDALTDDAARPSLSTTNEATAELKREFRARLESMAADRLEAGTERARKQALGKKMGRLPAGMPLAPVPTHWYATANVWVVEVQGTYERFVVRANRSDARSSTAYVRDGGTARLHHDGRSLRLGRSERVSFRTETVVVVVVPSGPTGVGDTDGEMDEKSPGWPPDDGSDAGG